MGFIAEIYQTDSFRQTRALEYLAKKADEILEQLKVLNEKQENNKSVAALLNSVIRND